MNYVEAKKRMFLREAKFYIGIKELDFNNGEFVRMFQNTIGGAQKEEWCMSFVQFCLRKIDSLWEAVDPSLDMSSIVKSEHCMTVWNKTPTIHRTIKPTPGCIIIWQHGNGIAGHTGILESVDGGNMTTIEGNTHIGPNDDGVYMRRRSMVADGQMKVVGFLNPWV